MKKKILTLLSVVLVIVISTVMLVSCAPAEIPDSSKLALNDFIKADDSIDASKISSNEVTAAQWAAATSGDIFDNNISAYVLNSFGNSKHKLIFDGKNLSDESLKESIIDGEVVKSTEIVYFERLVGDNAKRYTEEDGVWSANEVKLTNNDLLSRFSISSFTTTFDDCTYDTKSNSYIQDEIGATVTIKFTGDKLSYMHFETMLGITQEVVFSYVDATVTLPEVPAVPTDAIDAFINEDGSIKTDKIIGSEITAEQLNAAIAASILDKDLSAYVKTMFGPQKIVLDGKKIFKESVMKKITTTVYQERLEGDDAKEYTFKDDIWSAEKVEITDANMVKMFGIPNLNGKFDDLTYDATLKQYTYVEAGAGVIPAGATLVMKFTDNKLSYMAMLIEEPMEPGKFSIILEALYVYDDVTVTLPVVAE